MDYLINEMEVWLRDLVGKDEISRSRANEIWEFFNEECEDTSIPHAFDLADQEIQFALKGK